MNKVLLIGNLTADPEQINTTSGTVMCRFSIAVNRIFRNTDEKTVDFLRIVVFNKSAENCLKYLTKGSKVGISGRIQVNDYTDKEGVKRQVYDIIAEDVEFINTRRGEDGQDSAQTPSKPKVVGTSEELPF